MANLKHEIQQKSPFSGLEEEAILNLIRTADFFQRALQQQTRRWGVTATQYNILRILRGAQPEGLPCAAIGARMLTAEPDVTRLLSRLKKIKFVAQHRDQHDGRVVWTQITESGLKLLREMDPLVRKLPASMLGHVSKADLRQLIRLLELARLRCPGTQPPKEERRSA
jgi:MarR family transcriptional regulator, 2-MHQ and catechol-resistance regulon repressor